ncbi:MULTISPECIES: hypothetical protein [Kitasatospora]|uniref:Uncharacterized protein n=1 Tax=Kitasatospora cystarginea TaxID=58350 RepID=A0ABP5RXG2_9ACTN
MSSRLRVGIALLATVPMLLALVLPAAAGVLPWAVSLSASPALAVPAVVTYVRLGRTAAGTASGRDRDAARPGGPTDR